MQHYIAYEGNAVALAALQDDYVPFIARAINRRVGLEGTMQRGPYDPALGKEWIERLRRSRGTDEVFAVLKKVDGNWIYSGNTGIHAITWPNGTGTTGSMIFDQEHRGAGEGTEAKLLLLYHAFRVLGLRKIRSTVKAFNAPSLGHLLKCGYQIVGRYRQECFHEGSYVDEILLEVFPEDWEPIWSAYQDGNLPRLSDEQRVRISDIAGSK